MRSPVLAVVLLACAVSSSADTTGAALEYGPEAWAVPGSPVDCTFLLTNGSASEPVATVAVQMGYGVWHYGLPGYDEIEPGRPNWDASGGWSVAVWTDVDGGAGEVFPGESTQIWVTVTPSDDMPYGTYEIGYVICGDGTGLPPHETFGVAGHIYVGASGTIPETVGGSWGRVKALFR
jgi:hypothetical protein